MKITWQARAIPTPRWNFWVLGLDIAFFTIAINISSTYTILPLFVHHLTPQNWPVALITTLRMLGLYGPALFVAGRVERLERVKPTILWLTIGERVPFLILALAVIVLAHGNVVALLAIFFLMVFIQAASGGLTFPPWLDLISRTIPDKMRGRFLGGWSGTGNLMGLGAAALAAGFLAWFPWPWNFAACFMLSFLFVTISFVLLSLGREPRRVEVHRPPARVGTPLTQGKAWVADMSAVIRGDTTFRRFLLANALSGVALLGSGLLAVAALRQAHLSSAVVGLETTVVLFAIMAGNFGWGFIGDRLGHRSILIGSSAIGALAMVMALMAHDVVVMTLAFLCFGLGTAGIQLAQLTYVVEFGPPARRPVYIGLAYLLLAPFATAAPLVGGIMADRWGYTPVFFMAALLWVVATLVYWLWVHDPHADAQAQPSLVANTGD